MLDLKSYAMRYKLLELLCNLSKKIPQSGIHNRCMANIKPMQQVKCALGGMERGYQKIGGGGIEK